MGNPIIANDPNKLVWLRLKQLTSVEVCRNLIKDKCTRQSLSLPEETIDRKSIGLASAIDSALGYWQEKPSSLNSWVLSRYYALLQLTIAEQVSSPNNQSDLASIQKHTEQGHGLAIWLKGIDSPLDYNIYGLKGGHFYSYAKYLGLEPKEWAADRRAKDISELEMHPSVSIKDLFQHIPELEPVLYSFIQEPSKCLHIGHSSENHRYEDEIRRKNREEGNFNFSLPKRDFTFVSIYENLDNPINLELILDTKIPLDDIRLETNEDSSERSIFNGKLNHETGQLWWSAIEHYKSSFTGSMFIEPMFGKVNDIVVRHFFLLYGLSILVRYTPDVWHEIKAGSYDNIGSLIEYYLTTFEEVIPLLMLDRITGKKHRTAQPGSMQSLV
ncbi:hypothetical protein VOA_001486 [Vibrio sp. RC586]|uniref:YaaC family protein n=1 Tax=Vibrio sp. RC586 TaxID=675815 RepID=UPI0001BB855B|nr:YaaC family protein [Vibrio sp. RC586]EEY99137.1 hypothetical protein VOA_001486 [Vibrio sp. RC586]EJL6741080.1 hypothetical protein [Vibrio cholerae]